MMIHMNDDENDYSKIADEIHEKLEFGGHNINYDKLFLLRKLI